MVNQIHLNVGLVRIYLSNWSQSPLGLGSSLETLMKLLNNNAGLSDLGYSGDLFTWYNHREAPHMILERLDRACGNNNWRLSFPNTQVSPLESIYSDHTPLLIELAPVQNRSERYVRPFRFEAAWTRTVDCEKIISDSWLIPSRTSAQDIFQQKINFCHSKLLAKKKMGCGVIGKKIVELEKKITQLRSRSITAENKNEENRLKNELEELLQAEEVVWKQRAKSHWLMEGDRNTRFFHAQANRTFQRNFIKRLKDSAESSVNYLERGVEALSKVDSDMNLELLNPNTTEEITLVMSHMAPLKSPGPDDMPPIFFHKYWHIVKHDVFKCALSILNDRVLGPKLNFTHISLIPKRFHECFVQLVLLCVSSVSYSVMLSGRQFGKIIPERGLHQGNLLSPYLFLVCIEALSSLITKAETSGQLDGIRIYRNAPSISHLFFVDDTLLCCQASLEAMGCIQSILQVYGKASGQEINLQKLVVVFSKNTPPCLMTTISDGLGIRMVDRHEKYLGLPYVVGR
ncbi:UNVERIFIED_CONTAM: hypothetical protein Slati_3874700 [Sesamum latifolium]|uniref:Reverse transcriptase domain-containing protein n=1 Tax=Sesamum latifolium TaxID=2727402 RepID=A0AAW2TM64_9LAMI